MSCPQVPPHDVCLEWTAPSTFVAGNPILDPITYKLYRNGLLVGSLALTTTTITNEQTGRQCYRVTAVVNGVESTQSNELCKTVKLEAPTNGAIE